MMRSHRSGELRAGHAGEQVRIAGWVHHRRDHGKLIFLDVRDASGTVQVVISPDAGAAYQAADLLQREWCVLITGTVTKRKSGTENPKLPSGDVEIVASEVEVLSRSEIPPFVIEDNVEVSEETRLKYRYLDLRRPEMQRVLRLRHNITRIMHRFFSEHGFTHIDTPSLTRSTPEGARDFLVPSRLHPGSFFALPQSPQLFKQLMMVAGMERYYQIARCWRDEDLRADRQLEFMQLDVEMSFIDELDIQELTEALMVEIWKEVLGIELHPPFLRMTYAEMMDRFGSDKADLRFGLELVDVADVFSQTQLGIFKRVLEAKGRIKAIRVPQAGFSNAELRRLEQLAKERGAGGLAWIVFKDNNEIDSPLAKFLSDDERAMLGKTTGAQAGDVVLIAADKASVVDTVLGSLRVHIAEQKDLIPKNEWAFAWMTDPPLFEWSDDDSRWVSVHHPFTAPQGDPLAAFEAPERGSVRARAYDLVLNGVELGGGSIRIHQRDVQVKVLEALGRDPHEFDFLLDALGFGAPPHGGIALGLDRLVMMMAGRSSIRDAIAFPVTGDGSDPLTGAPTPVAPAQLDQLGLKQKL